MRLKISWAVPVLAKSDDLAAGLMWLVEAYCKEPEMSASKRELYETRFSAALSQHPKLCQLWHHDGLSAMAVSPDGRYVAMGGKGPREQMELRIWDATKNFQSPKLLHTLSLDGAQLVSEVEFCGEGENLHLLAVTRSNNLPPSQLRLRIWHCGLSSQPIPVDISSLDSLESVVTADFLLPTDGSTSPGLVALVEGESSTIVKFWKSLDETPQVLPTPSVAAPMTKLAVQREHGLVSAWGSDGQRNAFQIWNLKAAKPELAIDPLTSAVQFGAFSPSGKLMVTIDVQGHAFLWDTTKGSTVAEWDAHTGPPLDVAFGPDDRHIVSTGEDQTAKLWQIADRQTVLDEQQFTVTAKFEWQLESWIVRGRFSPDGRYVATAERDRVVRFWDVATGRQVGPPLHHAFGISNLEFSPDGNHLLTQIFDTVQVWQLSTDNPLPQPMVVGTSFVKQATSPNNQYQVVFGRSDSGIEGKVWNLASGVESGVPPIKVSSKTLEYACISDDGRSVLTVVPKSPVLVPQTAKYEIELWDVVNSRSQKLEDVALGSIHAAAFSPDGKFVIAAGEVFTEKNAEPCRLQVWDVETGQPQLQESGATSGTCESNCLEF